MVSAHRDISKTDTRRNGEVGPKLSKIGPPITLKSRAPRPRKKVNKTVIAPLTSLGRFFINSDSKPMTIAVDAASSKELSV